MIVTFTALTVQVSTASRAGVATGSHPARWHRRRLRGRAGLTA